MSINKEPIHVVWLKRDLRLDDNEAITNALASNNRTLLLYAFEETLIHDPHYSERHWDFIKQSIEDINLQLQKYNTKVFAVNSEVIPCLNQLQNYFSIDHIYSHQETGLLITFNRDRDVNRYCKNNSIEWTENINNGVLRGLLNREDWFENWNRYMHDEQFNFKPRKNQFLTIEEIDHISTDFNTTDLKTSTSLVFQKGGTTTAWKYANSFFEERHKEYLFNISKPEKSRTSSSRLSPYIAWGNVSIRSIFQKATFLKSDKENNKHLGAFISRLRWQAHFIQKFEMEHTMEESSINKGYHKLKKSISETYKTAWETGMTGFPLVDASMRCLNETGYLNFRMRSMLVSFFTHILWQPWQEATAHLSKMFLDFEPGIHFPQLQMQAGETGINSLRIYNPIKNSLDHDAHAVFIKKWCPELANLPVCFIHEPYLMTALDMQFSDFELGIDYPKPVVDIKTNRKKASDILWNLKKNPLVQEESFRILKRHTLSNRSKLLPNE